MTDAPGRLSSLLLDTTIVFTHRMILNLVNKKATRP